MSDRHLVRVLILIVVVLAPAKIARAGDRDFDLVVSQIKHQYHAKQRHLFPFGLARLAIKMAHPAGLKSINLAVFEQLSDTAGNANLDAVLRDNLSRDWAPIIRVYSKRDREQTYIYVRPAGHGDLEVLLVAIDQDEATVLKAKVDPKALEELVNDHEVEAAVR